MGRVSGDPPEASESGRMPWGNSTGKPDSRERQATISGLGAGPARSRPQSSAGSASRYFADRIARRSGEARWRARIVVGTYASSGIETGTGLKWNRRSGSSIPSRHANAR